MGNPGNVEVGFSSADGKRFATGTAKRVFEEADRAFDKNAMTVEIVPKEGVAGDTGVKAKVFIRVGIVRSLTFKVK